MFLFPAQNTDLIARLKQAKLHRLSPERNDRIGTHIESNFRAGEVHRDLTANSIDIGHDAVQFSRTKVSTWMIHAI